MSKTQEDVLNEMKKTFKEEILKILTEERRIVNNFPLVEKLLEFKSNDDFYFVQIIKGNNILVSNNTY